MSQKSYVIRKIAYHFSDECSYVHCMGGIEAVIGSKEEAIQKFKELECEEFRGMPIYDMPEVSHMGDGDEELWQELHDYFVEQFKQPLFETKENGELDFSHHYIEVPCSATDEQAWAIKEMTGITFHEIGEFDQPVPEFYGIWLLHSDSFLTYSDQPYFFDSKDEAIGFIKDHYDIIETPQIISGSLSSISNQPTLLQSLINRSQLLKYNDKKQQLEIERFNEYEIITLNEILKKPFFELRPISLEEAQQFDHDEYAIM
ncbi:hypothetical protein [Spartinivicinus poritis]|uniref:Uncharacterized protein n=1 Tax=Spartinivicinus poritis TaxID=2994640 RepID=A0ABT5UFB9_9GAMM|nr:hypothetical protein [Spartinivicinus sp. A2-2]MDE1465082.1 hypothetical protein [Spartinivicinus sp. A2-2]